jgi:cell division protein FtsI/penicillin-binding protein 2
MGRRVLHDHHRYGVLSVGEILVKSSNIGMAKIGERLTNAGLYEAALAFGFGSKTGIELPGELAGVVRPLSRWNRYSTGSVPMGQEIAATPLQSIAAYAALSNDGRLITPQILLPAPADGRSARTVIVSQALDPAVARWVRREALCAVVSRGTGRKAALRGYDVFGKTGTAQKPDPKTGLYSRERHVSSFVCGAPADRPRALVMISVDEPSVSVNGEHFGGSVAAPAAGALLGRVLAHLHVPPDERLARRAQLARQPDDLPLE